MVTDRARAVWRALAPFFFLGSALLLTLLFDRSFLVQSDEGYTVNAAWQLWSGRRMYDDFRLFVGPGSGYAILLVWKVLGRPSYLGARFLAVALSFSSTVALYLSLRRAGVRGLNLTVTVVGWMLVGSLYVPMNHNSFSSYAALWFLLPFLRLAGGAAPPAGARSAATGAAAGFAAGLVFIVLPTKGALLAATAAAFLLVARRRALGRLPVLALLGAFALTVSPLFLRWAPRTLLRQWFLIPLEGNYLGHTGAGSALLVAASILVIAMGALAFRWRDNQLQALAAVQAALFASTLHNMELAHFAINSFPLLLFASLAARRRWLAPRLPEVPAALTIGALTAVLLAWSALSPSGRQYLSTSTLDVDVLGHRPVAFTSPRIAAARAIYAGPFLPGLYYLLGKQDPFFVSETVVCNADCQRRLVGELEAVRPELAFLDYEMTRDLGYDQNAPVDSYLRQHYALCPGRGEMTVRALDPRSCP
jgi:hypothetical protein